MSDITFTFPEAVDSTMLSAFGACPQKFFLEFLLGRAPLGKSIHLHAGGAFAKALEVARMGFYKDGLSQDAALEAAYVAFTKFWGDYEAPEREYKDYTNMWGAVDRYFQEYPMESDLFQPVMMDNGAPAVEFRFSIPMLHRHPDTGNPVMFAGRLDQLSTDTPGTCYAQDEKTTKALGGSWPYQWSMRGQFYGYTYAARQYGYPCQGALIRGVAIQQTQYGFAEHLEFFTDDQLERWWTHANKKLGHMIEMYEDAQLRLEQGKLRSMHDTFTMSFGDACSSYGGCQYTDLCKTSEPWHIYSHYDKRVWNPGAQDPTAESEDKLGALPRQTLAEILGQ